MINWQKIRCLILDVDGICTDGKLHYSNLGETIKTFSVLDGQGIKQLIHNNINVAIISGRTSEIVSTRFSELGVQLIYQGKADKVPAYNEILATLNLTSAAIAYMGDDLPDLPLIKKSAIGISVTNGHPSAKQAANFICKTPGGSGAVREICDLILAAKA